MSKMKKADPIPAPPPVIPLPDEEMIKKDKKREIARAAAKRGGRESTIFTDTLG